jgi:hypothetical protein
VARKMGRIQTLSIGIGSRALSIAGIDDKSLSLPATHDTVRILSKNLVYACRQVAWNPNFNTADLSMLLTPFPRTTRYTKHFLKHA